MNTRHDALTQAAFELKQSGIENPWFEAQLLLSTVLNIGAVEIIAHKEQVISAEDNRRFRMAIAQRVKRKPLAYITGKKQFMNWEFMVSEDVLIPRPETETLVELAVSQLEQRFPGQPLRIADVGTGSGIIGLSMVALLPKARLFAIDLSEPALLVARRNAQILDVQDRVSFYTGDLLGPLEGQTGLLHCLTANLPYISDSEYQDLQPEVLKFEPREALVSGADGLRHYRRLLRRAKLHLEPDGLIFIEIGSTQAQQVQKIFVHSGLKDPRVVKDLAGQDRVVWAENSE